MITVGEPYHLAYLKRLKPLRVGHFDDELLNDGYHRVLLSRMTVAAGAKYDNAVFIESKNFHPKAGQPDWKAYKAYPAATGPMYCVPDGCGTSSYPAAVATALGKILTTLGTLEHRATGDLLGECEELRLRIHNKLQAEGWRVNAKQGVDGWKVLQPLKGVRNDQ